MSNEILNIIIESFKGSELSVADKKILDDWLKTDDNGALYAEMKMLYDSTQFKAANYTPDSEFYWQEMSRRLHLDAKSNKLKNIWLRRSVRYAAACVAALILLLGGYMGRSMLMEEPLQMAYSTYGGKSKFTLPDGTSVWLRGTSTISFPSSFTKHKRLVKLEGEAFFDVVKNKKSPFMVDVDGLAQIEVLGTQFNVSAKPESDKIIVSLNEGAIDFKIGEDSYRMSPRDIISFDKRDKKVHVMHEADVTLSSIWKSDKVYFHNESLGEIADKLEQWYGVEIIVDSAIASKYRYTFTLRSESLEEVLRIMSMIHPISYTYTDINTVEIR